MKKRTGFTQIVMAIITIIAITSSMVLNGSSAVAQPGVNQGKDLNLPDLNLPDLNLTAGILSGLRSYIYGYPLVMMGITQRLTTNVPNLAHVGPRPKESICPCHRVTRRILCGCPAPECQHTVLARFP